MTTISPTRARAGHRRRLVVRGRHVSGMTVIGVTLVLGYLLLAVLGPMLTVDPLERTGDPLAAPSAAHWFGTDHLGRDLLSRVAAGARVSVLVAVISVGIGLVFALPLGVCAGYFAGRWPDELIMRVFEAIQTVPLFVFAMVVLGVTGVTSFHLGPIEVSAAGKIILLIAIAATPYFARVARAATLAEVQEDYIPALRLLGVSRRRVIMDELMVNVLPPVIVQSCLWMAVAVFAEGALGFLGVGVQPPTPTLGGVIADATRYMMAGAWWYCVMPGLVLLVATVGFGLLGDGANDLLDRGER
ncbi:ABC transporter permease [Streptomyces sp. NPDC001985]|uniref:ABC transporter permease n=1 Tax=Streptomyces sp. NPDC001985 TaxID=3154406 RepID=UPI0033341C3C